MAKAKQKSAAGAGTLQPPATGGKGILAWLGRNRYYFIAFFLPVAFIYIAYAIFGMYPFGDESVLCLDLNGQYIYYFEAIRDAFHGDGSILYNWSRNLSGDYMGIIGYYLASPFTLIVILLPRTMILGAMLIMILCKLGCASVAMFHYLRRSKGLQPMYAVILSLMYSMCAYGIIQTIDPMWLDGMVFLPLICLGVEYLVDDGRKLNYIIPLAIMCVANFYIGFMCCIFTAFYFLYYVCFASDKLKYDVKSLALMLGRMVIATAVAMMCAAFMILPVYNALSLGKFDFTTPDYSFRTQFDPLEFIAQFAVNQYNSVNVEGKPEIYCGVLAFLFLPLFYLNNRIRTRKKLGYTFLIAVMFLSMYIKPIDMLWHGGQVPNWLPFRYSFIFSFIVISMAGMAFRYLGNIKAPAIGGSVAGIAVLMLLINSKQYLNMKDKVYLDTFGSIWLTIIFAAIYAAFIYFMGKKNPSKKAAFLMPLGLLAVVGGELTYNAVCTFKDIDVEVAYSTRTSYVQYVQSGRDLVNQVYDYDQSFYRAEKTYVRTVNDNSGFGLRGLTHSSSVMNTKVLKFIEAMGYSCRSYYSRYDGNTPLADSLLGIKYVLDRDGKERELNPTYEKVMEETCINQSGSDMTIGVYKNPNALSLGYMVDEDIKRIGSFGNDNPFNSQNILMSTITGNTSFKTDGNFESWAQYYYPISLTKELRLNGVYTQPYGMQTNYREEVGAADPTIDIFIEAQSDDPIYFFFKTENESRVNLWLADQWNEEEPTCKNKDGSNAISLGSYFETDNYHVFRLGNYQKGDRLQLRLTLTKDGGKTERYTIVKNFFFYHFDEDMFQKDIDSLKEQQWELTEYGGRTLEGKITAKEDQIMMTSIPYEPGWTVWVDGKKVEPVELFTAMIGIPLEPGEHTVKMQFASKGFYLGLLLLVCGLFCCVMFFILDRKHNPMMLMIAENRKKGIYEIPVEEEPEVVETKVIKIKASEAATEVDKNLVADELIKLKKLLDDGVLTQEEFDAQKKKLLNQ